MQLVEGKEVTLISARGPIRRTIIRLLGDVVAVGSQQDYEQAQKGVFGPFLIGFRVSDVIDDDGLDSLVLLNAASFTPGDTMTIWMYYATDGDSGYYGIRLFKTKAAAEAYKRERNDAYGLVKEMKVEP